MRRSSAGFGLVALAIVLTGLLANACNVPASESSTFAAPGLRVGLPEDVGMSSERLERLDDAMQGLIDDGRLAGMTIMLARHGEVVHSENFGMLDREADVMMHDDAIFRIYSMTKPITGVAMMMLYEEGKFRLSDPVEMYLPEFAGLQVASGVGPNGLILEDTDHPMTMRELMSHSAGLTYGIFGRTPVDSMYREAAVLDNDITLEEMVRRLGEIPLQFQPGSRWHYSVATDVQGRLVEVLSGQAFDEFLAERVFGPLGMIDTGFWVPEEKVDRFAQVYDYDRATGALVAGERAGDGYLEPPISLSGGGGLVSTIGDYMRFCQMLLNGGELDGLRLLSPTTVDLMTQNQLPRDLEEMAPGRGFGLNVAVVLDPVAADGISAGEYYWGGLAGTWFWIDPVEDLVFIGMIQQFGADRPDVRSLSRRLVYQAITESAARRSAEE